MTTRPTTATGIYVNLPVADLDRSTAFFRALGFAMNPGFSDHTASCIELGEPICVMLLTHEKFAAFTPHPVSDARRSTEVLVCLSLSSRAEVEDLVRRAVAGGATTPRDPVDHGFMYQHGFHDLDGHVWELVHMDMAAFDEARKGATS